MKEWKMKKTKVELAVTPKTMFANTEIYAVRLTRKSPESANCRIA